METNVKYTAVGAFVIGMTLAIIFAVIWIAAGFNLEKKKIYKVYMTESVSGLNLESPVEFNGVIVGDVRSMKINSINPRLVELLLEINKSTPVTQCTTATISMRGITGINFIALEDKGKNKNLLADEPGEEYPVIKTRPSTFLRLETALSNLNDRIEKISDAMENLLSKENIESFKQTLKSTKGTMQQLQQRTLPAAVQTFSNFDDVAQNISDLSAEIQQNPAVMIRGKSDAPLGPGEK